MKRNQIKLSDFTTAEIKLIEKMAERTWPVVEWSGLK